MPLQPMITGARHMISAGHYLAAEAGDAVLRAGGNVVDAGVAAGIALGVVHSDQVQFSGVAPMVIHLADRDETVTIAGLGGWPRAARIETFVEEHAGAIPVGLLRTVVPAAPDAWILALDRPMRAGIEAMRFGAVKYILPFFFVYNPALVAQHPSWLVILLVSFAALLGVGLIAYALQGYVLGVGPLVNSPAGYVVRAVLVVSGVMLAAPEPVTDLVGLAVAVVTYAVLLGAAPVRAALLAPGPTVR